MTSSPPEDHELPAYADEPAEAETSTSAARKENQPLRKGETHVATRSQSPPPPEFTDYRAQVALNSSGDVCSHDPHLNKDPEALLRFILLHCSQVPELWVSLKGEHDESRHETYIDAQRRLKTRTTVVTVTDFDFDVPARTAADPAFPHRLHIVPPELPAWRGRGFFRRGGFTEGRIALPADMEAGPSKAIELRGSSMSFEARRKADDLWCSFKKRGLPLFLPWTILEDAQKRAPYFDQSGYEHPMEQSELEALGNDIEPAIYDGRFVDRQSRNLNAAFERETMLKAAVREWCDVYCSESRPFKEFEVTKSFHGWHFARLETALRTTIRLSGYTGRIHINWRQTSSSIRVLPATRMSKIFTLATPLKLLLTLSLVYPIMLILRICLLGAHFDVVRSAYGLTRWVPMPSMSAEAEEDMKRRRAERLAHLDPAGRCKVAQMQGADGRWGWWQLIGQTEDAWLVEWRDAILQAIFEHKTGSLHRRPADAPRPV